MVRSALWRALVATALGSTAVAAQSVSLGSMTLGSSVAGSSMSQVAVTGMPFTSAQHLVIPQKTDPAYNIQATVAVNSTLDSGKAALVTYYVRSSTLAACTLSFRFELMAAPWTGSMDASLTAPGSWVKVRHAFLVQTPAGVPSFTPGQAGLRFRLGYTQQQLDIGGIEMTVHPGTKIDSLEALVAANRDTTWRAQARQKIAQNRTGTFTVRVQNQSGQPLPGATVRATMVRHDFDFGTMIDDLVLGSTTNDIQYKTHARQMFNAATQRMYWAWNWTDEQSVRKIEQCLDWADSAGLRSRGHTILYPSWWSSPPWLQSLASNPALLRDTIAAHMVEVARRVGHRVVDWDVINEMIYWTDLRDAVGGRQHYVDWYKLVKQHAPGALAAVNEFANIENGAMDRSSIDSYKEMVRYMLDNDAPVEMLGFQGHFESYTDPRLLWSVLDEFAQFGKPMRVTELDVNIQNEQVQASDLYDIMLALYAHPSMVGITLWGFWEGNMWNDRRGLVRRDWSHKPSYDTWQNLIRTTWWTPVQNLTSSASGAAAFTGYRAQYDVRVTNGPIDTTIRATFSRATDSLVVRLPSTSSKRLPGRCAPGHSLMYRVPGALTAPVAIGPHSLITVVDTRGRTVARSRGPGEVPLMGSPGAGVILVTGKNGDQQRTYRTVIQ